MRQLEPGRGGRLDDQLWASPEEGLGELVCGMLEVAHGVWGRAFRLIFVDGASDVEGAVALPGFPNQHDKAGAHAGDTGALCSI